MSLPLVSIVLPTCNGARHLGQAIDACLRQSHVHLEVIVVDDGSTDSTSSVVAQFRDRDVRLRSVAHDRNRGLPAALNTGFATAAGEYLTWTSDDNYHRPNAIARLVDTLAHDASIDIVYSDFTVIGSDGHPLEQRRVGDRRQLLAGNCIGACFLYRRRVQQALRAYDEDLFLAEDYDFWLRASTRFRMVPLHEDLYWCRDHQDSLSARFDERAKVATDRCLAKNLAGLTWASPAEKADAHVVLAHRALARREWVRACRHGLSALRLAPAHAVGLVSRRIVSGRVAGRRAGRASGGRSVDPVFRD
jgi:glycosyltransferase involved in cell wall biosynthesis